MAKLPKGFAKYTGKYTPKVTLQFWTTEEHLNIRLFARWWESQNTLDPRRHPLQLPDGEWAKKFSAWCETQAALKTQAKKRPLEKASAFNADIAREVALESGATEGDTDSGPEQDQESRKALQA